MNEFLQQFVIESRELVDAASAGLLTLEQSPQETQTLDAVFRAFHTLKGSAGIVEFPEMERVMHAAEDILSESRAGRRVLTPSAVGQCLACLDQVVQWLDEVERTGELPAQIQPATQGRADNAAGDGTVAGAGTPGATKRVWLDGLLEQHTNLRSRALTAVRFAPDPQCFYQGEDPLERMMSLPGLLALAYAPVAAWGPLETLDPFKCNLILTALSAAPPREVAAHLQGHSGDCDIIAVGPAEVAQAGADQTLPPQALPPQVADVVRSQVTLLSECTPENFAGRVGSAGLTAANALRFCGRLEQAEMLMHATEQSLLEKSVVRLREALSQVLSVGEPVTAGSSGADQAATVTHAPGMTVSDAPSPELTVRTLRVDAERVDRLVRLAGELTVVNNAIGHIVKLAKAGDPTVPDVLKDRHGTLEHLIGELQRSVLGMRVRPLRSVLQRFPRVVREMSASLGKPVKLTIEGDDTEADKAIVEMLFEPLLHVVRNAIDHGVENPSDRAARGKPAVAHLQIKARPESDQVLIEIVDDGSGIDIGRVRETAKARGLITDDDVRTMAEADVINLIFAPGFSTAAQITQVSGRGVGMDAVRKAVERIGGQVSVGSRSGQGTTVKLVLPFSVMMTHVMTVEAGGQMFGLPLEAIIETVRVPHSSIANVGATRAIVLRDRTIPLVDLATLLGIKQAPRTETEATIVIAAAGGEWGGFRVDRVGERLDLILKPLEGLLAGTPGIVGTTLLGDGRVLLVLDVGEMLQ